MLCMEPQPRCMDVFMMCRVVGLWLLIATAAFCIIAMFATREWGSWMQPLGGVLGYTLVYWLELSVMVHLYSKSPMSTEHALADEDA